MSKIEKGNLLEMAQYGVLNALCLPISMDKRNSEAIDRFLYEFPIVDAVYTHLSKIHLTDDNKDGILGKPVTINGAGFTNGVDIVLMPYKGSWRRAYGSVGTGNKNKWDTEEHRKRMWTQCLMHLTKYDGLIGIFTNKLESSNNKLLKTLINKFKCDILCS